MRFAEKLYKQMLLQGLNQQKLARRSLVSDSEVSRILGGKSQPGLENAFKLSKAVGVSLDFLADDTLETDPARPSAPPTGEEGEIQELIQSLGVRQARRILETVGELGYDVAIRRLLGLEVKQELTGSSQPRPAPTATPPNGQRNSNS